MSPVYCDGLKPAAQRASAERVATDQRNIVRTTNISITTQTVDCTTQLNMSPSFLPSDFKAEKQWKFDLAQGRRSLYYTPCHTRVNSGDSS